MVAISPPAGNFASADLPSVLAMNFGSFNVCIINHSIKYETTQDANQGQKDVQDKVF